MSVWAGFQDNSYKLISMCLDGPETPTIMGPTVALEGDSVTLTCNASSNPPSNYTWLFNNTVVANMSEYFTPPLTVNMSGMYACMAYNNVTGGYSSIYTILIVHGECSRTFLGGGWCSKNASRLRANDTAYLDVCFCVQMR